MENLSFKDQKSKTEDQNFYSILWEKNGQNKWEFLIFDFDLFNVIVGDPGDEQSEPIFFGFDDRDADARRAVISRRASDDFCFDFDGNAVRSVRANVEAFADGDCLVQVKQRAERRDVFGFGRFAPRRAVVRATGNDDGQTQSHSQRKTLFLKLRLTRSCHKLKWN